MNRENLSFILPVLGKLLYMYPDKDFLDKVKSAGLFEQIPYESRSVEFVQGRELLAEWHGSEEAYDAVVAEYQDLFVGVRDRVKTPAWESVYVAPDPVLFGECTLNVRMWYDRYGMEIKKIRHEPDDHMGLELIFLAHLLQADPDSADIFFAEHIALWYERFFTSMALNAGTNLYKGLALVLYTICDDIGKSISVKAS